MSSGSIEKSNTQFITSVYYKTYYQDEWAGWEWQANSPVIHTTSKWWSGADRPRIVRSKVEADSRKRFYTLTVTRSYLRTRGRRKGTYKTITRLVRKSFNTRPIPKRIRRGLNDIPHQYAYSRRTFEDDAIDGFQKSPDNSVSPWTWYRETRGDTVQRMSAWPSFAGLTPFDDNDQIRLVNKLKDKMRGSSFNMSVFLGEGHETLKLITQSALRLAEAGWYARKGHIKQAARVLASGDQSPKSTKKKLTGENWLQLQYGWLPLLSDMKEGAEQLAHILHYPKLQKYSVRIVRRGAQTGPFFWGTADKCISKNLSVYVTEPESLVRMSGLLDPEIVAWELVPFSFIADWVLPIGDYLGARAFAKSLQISAAVTTSVTTEKFSRLATHVVAEHNVNVFAPNSARAEFVDYSRTISSSIDVPLPAVKPLGKIASWIHCANALALVSVVFGPKKLPPVLREKFTVDNSASIFRENRSEFIPQWGH